MRIRLRQIDEEAITMLIATCIVLVLMLMQGCCRCKDFVRTDTKDSASVAKVVEKVVTVHDSVFTDKWHTVLVNGDTVRITDSIVKYRFNVMHDTLRATDTVYVERVKEITEQVKEKKGDWWIPVVVIFGISGAAMAFAGIVGKKYLNE